MYHRLAATYDNSSRDEFSRVCALTAGEILQAQGFSTTASLLDLACGTGMVVRELHNQGYRVTGVDLSPDMLALARQRDFAGPGRPKLLEGDIRKLPIEGPFSAALCFGDVVNHLISPEDLAAMLASVHRVLAPGGLFLCDTNTLETFRSRLWNIISAPTVHAEQQIQVRCTFDEEDGLAHMETIVAEKGKATAVRSLTERYYSDQAMEEALQAGGFTEVESRPYHPLDLADSYPEIATLKTLWIACKPGQTAAG